MIDEPRLTSASPRASKALRAERDLSLDALASAERGQRSMISLIERGESSPTAVVLEKLATALGVTLASLFDEPGASRAAAKGSVARRDEQPEWRDPGSGYVRRNVSPPHVPQPMKIVEVSVSAGRGASLRERRARAARVPASLGCSRHDGRHRREERQGCAKATAWRCSSISRRCFTTPRASARATRW